MIDLTSVVGVEKGNECNRQLKEMDAMSSEKLELELRIEPTHSSPSFGRQDLDYL